MLNPSAPDYNSSPRSTWVFTTLLVLVLLAVVFPQMSPQGLQGILWAGAGLLMLLCPPVVRLPRAWVLLAAGFVLFSLIGFLPRAWFPAASWRGDLETLGLDTGPHAYLQAGLAMEMMGGFVATTIVGLFLLGHRVSTSHHQRIALGFALGVGGWAAVALIQHQPGTLFGFFPNRNHTATLLVMGVFTGLGCLAHAIRRKLPLGIVLSALPVGVCLYALHVVSESRAGVVLVVVGFILWILLTGFRHLRGNVGKALVLILIAACGIFLLVDSTAKKRLTATVDQLAAAGPVSATTPENPFSTASPQRAVLAADGRISIFQDTLRMIGNESWTGVGPAQFVQVFPQYRQKTNASNDSKCLHPESDWLMMLAEVGWPAVVCLVAGVGAVFFFAVRDARRGSARFLRTGSIVAAMLLCMHGIFDVPGHRVGLAWAAVLLLATSLRPEPEGSGKLAQPPSRFSGNCWRVLGLVLVSAGAFLIYAQSVQRSVLPSEQVRQCMTEAKKLYEQDQVAYDRAKAESRDYQPLPDEDPLEIALLAMERAIRVTPLDPYLHYLRGSLALHYDDKHAVAEHSFAIQRRLEPTRVNLAMEQARAWNVQDPRQVSALWKEALRRASREESRNPGSSDGLVNTYQRLVATASKDESLAAAALELAGENSSLLVAWARSASGNLLDNEMPRLLTATDDAPLRKSLFQTWEKRGSKVAAAAFASANPELHLSPSLK